MKSFLLSMAMAGMFLLSNVPFLPGTGASVAQAQTTTERLYELNGQLRTQYELFREANNTKRYTAKVNDHDYDSSAKVARSQDFKDHDQAARDAYNRAFSAYNNRLPYTCQRELDTFRSEIRKMNSIGWYITMHKMRTSSDQDVQQRAYDAGYRDNKTWEQWHDRIVLPKTRTDRLWKPDLSSDGGGAVFGPAPDFNDRW